MGMVMPAWYDLQGSDLSRIRHDEAGVRRSAASIEQLVAREKARGLPSRRIVLAGFSQGGAMAMHVGLRHGETLGGVIALSSFLVLAETIAAEASPANRATPFFVGHGTRDPMVHESAGRRTRDLLSSMGWPVAYHTWPMEHSVCLEEIRAVGAFLAACAERAG
jgi:phospholipase/carboxylesterase